MEVRQSTLIVPQDQCEGTRTIKEDKEKKEKRGEEMKAEMKLKGGQGMNCERCSEEEQERKKKERLKKR